jgi:eukaryotic-like serine/threonine-protein kinase
VGCATGLDHSRLALRPEASASSGVSHAPREQLGPYELVAPLGAGGMGEVFRARDHRLGREVAVKVLAPGASADPERLKRFEAEARAASALNHPNIVAVYDAGREGAEPFIVTELLEGQTLRERLAAGPVPPRKALELGVQLARGLAAAHERGITHRDLKPENVFVTRDGQVKILDFGLAHVRHADRDEKQSGTLTNSGAVLGTAGYMAPEQLRGEDAGARADLFALGAILYELLSGERAFPGTSALERGMATLQSDPPGLVERAPAVPPRRSLRSSPVASRRPVRIASSRRATSPSRSRR